MNMHEFDRKIAKREGLKEQVNIAQIGEIRKIVLEELAKEEPWEVLKLLLRYSKK